MRPHRPSASERAELLRDLGLGLDPEGRQPLPPRHGTRVGRWVDVVTGRLRLEQRDFSVGLVSPLVFDRVWSNGSTYRGPLGRGWHHAYDAALARGAEYAAMRTPDGRVAWLPLPLRGRRSHDAGERLSSSSDGYGFVVRSIGGDELRFVPHRARAAYVLGALRDAGGRELRFAYDRSARLTRIADPRGLDLELAYDAEDRLIEISGPHPLHASGRVALARFTYDSLGRLRAASDALGQARRYVFADALLAAYVDRNGCSTQFEWSGSDADARCVRTWIDAGTRTRELEFAPGRTRVRNSRGHAVVFVHDGSQVQRVLDDRGDDLRIPSASASRGERATDALGEAWRWLADAHPAFLERFAAAAVRDSVELAAGPRIRRVVDARGGSWKLEYDARGRLVQLADPSGHAAQVHYRGRWLVGVTAPNGRHTAYAYDGAGRLSVRTAPGGAETRYRYDAWGQLLELIDPHGNRERREYDLLGRLVRVWTGEGRRVELGYDAEGRLVRCQGGARDIRFTYSNGGRVGSRSEGDLSVCFEYDGEEQLVGVVDEAGDVCRLQRDAAGRVIALSEFGAQQRTFVRDAAGRVVRVEREGHSSEYELDEAGRVVEVQHSDGGFEGYCHGVGGALESAWNQTTTVVFERDALGRVVCEQQGEHSVRYLYDAAGELIELRSSLGATLVIERGRSGAIRRLWERQAQLAIEIVRDALGLEIERKLPGGVRSAWQRDALGRPRAQRLESATGALVDRRSVEAPRSDRSGVPSRLALGDATAGSIHRPSRAAGSPSSRRVRDEAARAARRHEPSGWKHFFGANGQLLRAVSPDGMEVSFGYDPFGRRVWKRCRGRTTRFVWAGGLLLHEWVEEDVEARVADDAPTRVFGSRPFGGRVAGPAASPEAATDTALRLEAGQPCVAGAGTRSAPITWIHDPDSGWPVARLEAGGRWAFVTDSEGTPRALLDDRGLPRWAADGELGVSAVPGGAPMACPIRAFGRYEDAETGLHCGGLPAAYCEPDCERSLGPGPISAGPSLRAQALARVHRDLLRGELRPPHEWLVGPCSDAWVPAGVASRASLLAAPFCLPAEPEQLGCELLREAFEDGEL